MEKKLDKTAFFYQSIGLQNFFKNTIFTEIQKKQRKQFHLFQNKYLIKIHQKVFYPNIALQMT